MLPIQEVFPELNVSRKIFITTHHKPDGDAIGSMLALSHYLAAKGHFVSAVSPSEVPDFLRWMPGCSQLINFESTPDTAIKVLKEAEIIFCLDFNDPGRTKHMETLLLEAKQPKVLIDHHLFPKDVWDYGVSMPEKSSTCEMVFDFIRLAGDDGYINSDIATCLYVGVMTDTGSFKFPATTPSVHTMVARLLETGIDHTAIHEHVYDAWSESRMRFLGYVLIEKMEVFRKFDAALIVLSRKDMNLFNVQNGDTEGLVNYPLSIKGIRFSTLITERGDEIKMSFRSKGDFDVSKFARLYFEGGGHFNASGGRSKSGLDDTVAQFKRILEDNHPK
ncbi:MAG: DHH family phosphoesterase [Taibaiella sp.]|nr:DHH family phosphoesterase [Taibaiella sp.]